MTRRPKRPAGLILPRDVVVVKPWKFRIEGVKNSTDRRVGIAVEEKGGTWTIYCPKGGFVNAPARVVVRASADTERRFRATWEAVFASLRRGR